MAKKFLNNKITPNSGFSLIEILTVVALIGIISLIGFPVYKSISPNIALNSSVRDMTSDLRYAQQLAVTEQKTYSVKFDMISNSYYLFQNASGVIIKSRIINGQVKIDSIVGLTSSTASFTVTGASAESGQITLKNNNGKTNIIDIKPSGYVKIQN